MMMMMSMSKKIFLQILSSLLPEKENEGIVYNVFDYLSVCCGNIMLSRILISNLKSNEGISFLEIFYIIF